MACSITSGFADTCRGSVGGINTVYIGNFPSGVTSDSSWLQIDPVTGIVTGFTGSFDIYEYKPNMDSSSFEEIYEANIENASFGFAQKLTLVFPNISASKQAQIKLMGGGLFAAVIKNRDGVYLLAGHQGGMVLSGGGASTGKVLSDGNKYTLELTANQGENAKEVTAAAVAALLA